MRKNDVGGVRIEGERNPVAVIGLMLVVILIAVFVFRELYAGPVNPPEESPRNIVLPSQTPELIVSDTPIPLPTNTPFVESQTIIATNTPRPTLPPRPDNCDEAVAWGLTAQQAGQWSHLDRDGDGVACYGD